MMESSSEDSFAWTNASSDTEDEETMVEENSLKNDAEESEHEHHDQIKTSKRKSKMKERKVKEEPLENHVVEKKNNSKENILMNGIHKDSKDALMLDNISYLNVRVKQEQSMPEIRSSDKSRKKNKHMKEPELNVSNSDDMTHIKEESDGKDSSKTKKNKSKKNSSIDYNDMIIEDKFSAEETIVQTPTSKRKDESGVKIKEEILGNENKKSKKKLSKSCTVIDDSMSQIERDFLTKGIPSSTFANASHQLDDSDSTGEELKSSNKQTTKSLKSSMLESINNTPKRTVRISDRIQYEDETSQDTCKSLGKIDFNDKEENLNHHNNNILKSSQFLHFLKDNPNLKLVSSKLQKQSLITENDEVWVLEYPQEIHVKSLQDLNLTLDSKCKVKICGQTYEGYTDEEANNITLITMENDKFIINQTPINGIIKFHKRVHKARSSENDQILNDNTSFMSLPDTKTRHSLLMGVTVPQIVMDDLEFSIAQSRLPVTEKKKKKKHRINCNETEEPLCADEQNSEMNHDHEYVSSSKKKKKKRKHAEDDEDIAPKKKRLKRNPSAADAWESEQAIEENLFNF